MIYQRILEELATHNCKITPQRREIIKTLIQAKAPLSAKQIFDRLRTRNPKMSFDTVYRNLAILKELQVVRQLDFHDGKSRFEIDRGPKHHHYLVCLKCGGAWKIDGCPMENLNINNIPTDFKVTNHRFELFGYCKDCRS
ncbi:Fur family transcriptional regulator [Thermincola potens]|uniref:Ferric uptake regulator, Fur family n=1 Tax=Thermincola potens (strain JR) TaxID=635013 RepID=D5X848_THEPJ|nr:Fur family transcriptional regulator [Thermincola potens]ADG82768.1 ferric uptake regulator, Fur family [Thermincola potens JR]